MSFFFDWWMLILFGIFIVILYRFLAKIGIKFSKDTFFPKVIGLIILIGFYIMSIGLFAGFTMGPGGNSPNGPVLLCKLNDWFFGLIKSMFPGYYAIHPNATSTEFMYSSAMPWLRNVAHVQFNNLTQLANYPMHLFVGVFIFCTYPLWIIIGYRLGTLLFGSKPGKKGMISLL